MLLSGKSCTLQYSAKISAFWRCSLFFNLSVAPGLPPPRLRLLQMHELAVTMGHPRSSTQFSFFRSQSKWRISGSSMMIPRHPILLSSFKVYHDFPPCSQAHCSFIRLSITGEPMLGFEQQMRSKAVRQNGQNHGRTIFPSSNIHTLSITGLTLPACTISPNPLPVLPIRTCRI
jgi:hypothetical protein